MRRVRDRKLAEPFRTWIDRDLPLPDGVVVLPRTIELSLDVVRLVYPGLGFLAMGVAFIALFGTSVGWPGAGGVAFLALSSLILFGVPLWLAHRLWRTFQARRDQQAGRLRLGILVGPQGMLVRVIPSWCYPIPLDRFVRATIWSGGGEDGCDWLRIETRDGPIDLSTEQLTVGPTQINQAVAMVRFQKRGK